MRYVISFSSILVAGANLGAIYVWYNIKKGIHTSPLKEMCEKWVPNIKLALSDQ